MTSAQSVDLIRETLWTAVLVAGPLLGICFVVGIIIGLLQVLTSQQDPAFATVPKLFAIGLALFFLLPWMAQRCLAFATAVITGIGRHAG